jgi:DNA-binding beta-propeller fold protein YncE
MKRLLMMCALASCGAKGVNLPVVPDAGDPVVMALPDAGHPSLPLATAFEVALPGNATRFDYQDVDTHRGHLVLAHMGDSEVLFISLDNGEVVGRVPNVDTVRGVIVADAVNRVFATAINGQVVAIDATTMTELGRSPTGSAPDGVGWDPMHQIVATSDQGAGALSLIASSGTGTRTPVPLGEETGNVIFDPTRSQFWVTVVRSAGPDQLVTVDPTSGAVLQRFDLPGCSGAHGLRLHPDGKTAFVACEGNDMVVRVDLMTGGVLDTKPVGSGVDVLAIDPGLLWLYAAAESGQLTVFDIARDGLVDIDHETVGNNAHSVAVDPATHHVFFPLLHGSNHGPTLKVMQPAVQ